MVSIGNFDSSYIDRESMKKTVRVRFRTAYEVPCYMDADNSHSFTVSALFIEAFIHHQ